MNDEEIQAGLPDALFGLLMGDPVTKKRAEETILGIIRHDADFVKNADRQPLPDAMGLDGSSHCLFLVVLSTGCSETLARAVFEANPAAARAVGITQEDLPLFLVVASVTPSPGLTTRPHYSLSFIKEVVDAYPQALLEKQRMTNHTPLQAAMIDRRYSDDLFDLLFVPELVNVLQRSDLKMSCERFPMHGMKCFLDTGKFTKVKVFVSQSLARSGCHFLLEPGQVFCVTTHKSLLTKEVMDWLLGLGIPIQGVGFRGINFKALGNDPLPFWEPAVEAEALNIEKCILGSSVFTHLANRPGLKVITVKKSGPKETFVPLLVELIRTTESICRLSILEHTFQHDESVALANAFRINKCISLLEIPGVASSSLPTWLDVLKKSNCMLVKTKLGASSDMLKRVDYYCALNMAGRAKLRRETTSLEDRLEILAKAPDDLVYGLFRDNPVQWYQHDKNDNE